MKLNLIHTIIFLTSVLLGLASCGNEETINQRQTNGELPTATSHFELSPDNDGIDDASDDANENASAETCDYLADPVKMERCAGEIGYGNPDISTEIEDMRRVAEELSSIIEENVTEPLRDLSEEKHEKEMNELANSDGSCSKAAYLGATTEARNTCIGIVDGAVDLAINVATNPFGMVQDGLEIYDEDLEHHLDQGRGETEAAIAAGLGFIPGVENLGNLIEEDFYSDEEGCLVDGLLGVCDTITAAASLGLPITKIRGRSGGGSGKDGGQSDATMDTMADLSEMSADEQIAFQNMIAKGEDVNIKSITVITSDIHGNSVPLTNALSKIKEDGLLGSRDGRDSIPVTLIDNGDSIDVRDQTKPNLDNLGPIDGPIESGRQAAEIIDAVADASGASKVVVNMGNHEAHSPRDPITGMRDFDTEQAERVADSMLEASPELDIIGTDPSTRNLAISGEDGDPMFIAGHYPYRGPKSGDMLGDEKHSGDRADAQAAAEETQGIIDESGCEPGIVCGISSDTHSPHVIYGPEEKGPGFVNIHTPTAGGNPFPDSDPGFYIIYETEEYGLVPVLVSYDGDGMPTISPYEIGRSEITR